MARASDAVTPRTLIVEPRLIRRVIRGDRHVTGFGLAVPHARCYPIAKAPLLGLLRESELPCSARELGEQNILVERPPAGASEPDRLRELWRATFHAELHLALDAERARGSLGEAAIRERIHRIGQTEFDEIRSALRQDDLLLPHADEIEVWIEFVATYCELRRFAPAAVRRMFPALRDEAAVDAIVAAELPLDALLARSRPDGAPSLVASIAPAPAAVEPSKPEGGTLPPSRRAAEVRVGGAARQARGRAHSRVDVVALDPHAVRAGAAGNHVREAIEHLQRARRESPDAAMVCRAAAAGALRSLAVSLLAALHTPKELTATPSEEQAEELEALLPVLTLLAERAAASAEGALSLEARVLYDLQRAVVDHGRPRQVVDVIGFVTSFFRRSVVRQLDAERPVRAVRHVRAAVEKLGRIALPEADKAHAADALHELLETAEGTLRGTLRPRIVAAFEAVGDALAPKTAVERAARDKLIGELLDHVLENGRFDVGVLRDAISRNQLKMRELGLRELFTGDALLRIDDALATQLDGVYRPGEIYRSFLQKVSSLFFGTWIGRQLTTWLILPIVGAFTVLMGVTEIAHLVLVAAGVHKHLHLAHRENVLGLAAFLLLLIKSATARAVTGRVFGALFDALAFVLFRGPALVLALPMVRVVLRSPPMVMLARHVVRPALMLLPFWLLLHRRVGEHAILYALGLVFLFYNLVASSTRVQLAEEIAADWSAQQWKRLRKQILPGVFRIVIDFFKWALDEVERGLYAVDEMLRFRPGDGRGLRVFKGIGAFVWFFVSYTVRLYVNLMVEPTFNPVKHFPVVTVAAKIIVPMGGTILPAMNDALRAVGLSRGAAGSLAGVTFFFLPGLAGFLIWELKENWKLYRATQPRALAPVAFGHHGENMGRLLKPGFHSGTIPKLYAKVRRAVRKNDPHWIERRAELDHVAAAIRHFVGRELTSLLLQSPRWTRGRVSVESVEIASNRVRVAFALDGRADHDRDSAAAALGARAVVHFEEQSGWLVAHVQAPGFFAALGPDERAAMENALAGLYAKAGVELVREQIEARIGDAMPYDIADEGLVLWPNGDYRSEVVYPLAGHGASLPTVRGTPITAPFASLDRDALRFSSVAIEQASWREAWEGAPRGDRLRADVALIGAGSDATT